MPHTLSIRVRFLTGRYHGAGDWPPAPARLFQALMAGAACGSRVPEEADMALRWLETLDPPVIEAPPAIRGQHVTSFVPNNDLDSVGGDPGRMAEMRVAKIIQPWLFDDAVPLTYRWEYEPRPENAAFAEAVVGLSHKLYRLGWGIDPAFATGAIAAEGEELPADLAGLVRHRPARSGGDLQLPCPAPGSTGSLRERFAAGRSRFERHGKGKRGYTSFARPPRGAFRTVAYEAPPHRLLYELGWSENTGLFAHPLQEATRLVETVRDGAIGTLARTLAEEPEALGTSVDEAMVERLLKGSKNATEADKAQRIRFIPLPSIGTVHTDPDIRRLLVEVPQGAPLSPEAVDWALSGLPVTPSFDAETGEIRPHAMFVRTGNESMLGHYGIDTHATACHWETITPAALPAAPRRRIDPANIRAEAKGAGERLQEEEAAARAVERALRHAGIRQRPIEISVRREPWRAKGARAEAFAEGTRFSKHALWHLGVRFAEPLSGPLLIGDGRFLGLGLMRPVESDQDVFVLQIDPETAPRTSERIAFLEAVRRALMSRAADEKGQVPPLFSGHEADGGPARSGRHEHLFLAASESDKRLDRLLVVAPWAADRSGEKGSRESKEDRSAIAGVLTGFDHVRAGRLGLVRLAGPFAPDEADPLLAPALTWRSLTPYRPTHHRKDLPAERAVVEDVTAECLRRGLPRPAAVEVIGVKTGPKGGLSADLRLRFDVAVEGPLLFGRDSHTGGGLFAGDA